MDAAEGAEGFANAMVALGELLFGAADAGSGAEGGAPGTAGRVDAGYIETGGTPHKVAMDGNGTLRDVVTGNTVSPNAKGYHPA